MRVVPLLLLVGSVGLSACDGDTSVLMSVYSDGGLRGQGGQGGQAQNGGAGGQGGSGGAQAQGGAGGASHVTVVVTGGARDLDTAQCVSASGNKCAVSQAYLQCVETNCASQLVACYYSDGVSSAAGGACRGYANCLFGCSCNSSGQKCEQTCMDNYVTPNVDCSTCLVDLYACMNRYGCSSMTVCTGNSVRNGD